MLEPNGEIHQRLKWRNDNWGTKFPPTAVEQTSPDDNTLEYFFDTAWTPLSDSIIMTIAQQFPELRLELRYAEIGNAYKGHVIAESGAITSTASDQIDTDVDFDDPEFLVNLITFQ